jgi:hypothetical protein
VFAALLHLFISHDEERVDESTVIGETLEVEIENAYSLHRSMSCYGDPPANRARPFLLYQRRGLWLGGKEGNSQCFSCANGGDQALY